jgi:folate-dependent phosphoribosylglycinamide formyltransferase PurN
MVETKEHGPRYMRGVIEETVHECAHGGQLHELFEVCAVITDDTHKDLVRSDYPMMPSTGKPWIHRLDLADQQGILIRDVTWNIASSFRSLAHDDATGRAAMKFAFEREIQQIAKYTQADVIISDHYMARIDHLHAMFPGRVLNIHPAVTKRDHPYCFRGPHPTADALEMARTGTPTMTGATLHYVNETIDDGPIIHWEASTPVNPAYTPEELRWYNYQAKRRVFTEGMLLYAEMLRSKAFA